MAVDADSVILGDFDLEVAFLKLVEGEIGDVFVFWHEKYAGDALSGPPFGTY